MTDYQTQLLLIVISRENILPVMFFHVRVSLANSFTQSGFMERSRFSFVIMASKLMMEE